MTAETEPRMGTVSQLIAFDGTIDWPVIGGVLVFALSSMVGYVRLHFSHGALQERVASQQHLIETSVGKLTELQNTVLIEQAKRESTSDSLEKLDARMSARFDKIESVVQEAVSRMLDAMSILRRASDHDGHGEL